MPERTLARVGSVLAFAGGVLAAVVNIAHPRFTDYDNLTQEILTEVSGSGSWVGIHVGFLFGALFLVGALVVLSRTIGGEWGTALARLGYAGGLIGGGIAVIQAGVDGFAVKALADTWAAAPEAEKAAAFLAADGVVQASLGGFTTFILVFLGATPIAFGLAIALGEGYPKWLGGLSVVAGGVGVAAGLIQAYNGPSDTVNVLITASGGVLTVFVFILGGLLWRKAAA